MPPKAVAGRRPPKRAARAKSSKQQREAPDAIDEEMVEINVSDLRNFNESRNFFGYGPSGHGKTVLAGGAPNAVYIAAEKGVEAAKFTGSAAQVIRTPRWEHVVASKKWCDQNLGPDDWAILDSLPKIQTLMLRWILEKINESNPGRDLDIPAIQDHQKWQNYFKKAIDSWIDAPYNCIFLATEMYREDRNGETIVLPAITGKDYEICNYIRAQMDVVFYYAFSEKTEDGEPIRRALFRPFGEIVAPKDRYNVLGRYWDVEEGDYTIMASWIDMINEAAAREAANRAA